MIGNIRKSAWIAICPLLVSSIVSPASDSVPAVSRVVEEISREESLNQLNADVLNARLKLEAWKLARLHVLRERGFATWLEVARQQLLVDALGKQCDALQEFAGVTRALRQRALLASAAWQDETYILPGRTGAPIKLSLPGSVRLVGWIENSQGLLLRSAGLEESAESTQRCADELKAATENLAVAETRCSGLSSSRTASEHWIQSAELQLALAQAEWQLARLKQNLLADNQKPVTSSEIRDQSLDGQLVKINSYVATGKTNSLAKVANWPFAEINNSVTAGSHHSLRESTLKVAEAEAKATGELRAAEIALQRFELRLQALQNLHEQGFAEHVEMELEAARQQVAEAVRRVDQVRRQQKNIAQTYQSLQASLQASDSVDLGTHENSSDVADSLDAIDLPAVETWPSSLLIDIEIVRHLIELRRASYETVARREALVLKLAMLESCLAKLESIVEKSRVEAGQLQHSIGKKDFKSNLLEGLRTEINALQLDISHGSALRQAAEERLRILTMEEMRFVQQSLAQQNALQQSDGNSTAAQFVAFNLADSLLQSNVALISRGQDEFTRYSYLESRDIESRESALEIIFWRATNRGCTLVDYPNGIRLLDVGAKTSYHSSTQIGYDTGSSYLSRPSFVRRLSACPADNELRSASFNLPEQRDQLGTSTYERAYPFGILRADLRSQQPVGFVPWYLPGSPTNYPYPNNR